MKKAACFFAVFCLTVMLAACGGKSGSTESAQQIPAEDRVSESAQQTPAEDRVSESTQQTSVGDRVSESAQQTSVGDSGSESAMQTSAEADSANSETGMSADITDTGFETAADTDSEEASNLSEMESEEANADVDVDADQAQKGRLLYMGHASLRITAPEGKVIYIDPYAGQGYEPAADLILVTHGHYDHFDMDKVANRNPDCRIITWQEALADGTHQTFDLGFAAIEAVEAGNNQYHSTDECVGYIVVLTDGTSVYVTGDTSTTQQMPSLAEKEIDYAFFCCDGIYNMDLEEAAQCAELVGAKYNTPYHMTAADSGALFDRTRAEQFKVPNLLIIEDGQEIELK